MFGPTGSFFSFQTVRKFMWSEKYWYLVVVRHMCFQKIVDVVKEIVILRFQRSRVQVLSNKNAGINTCFYGNCYIATMTFGFCKRCIIILCT